VDTGNLGEQAEQEMLAYTPMDDNRKFTELYAVQRLKSANVPKDAQVCISTIQHMYSILKGEPLDESLEEINPAEVNPAKLLDRDIINPSQIRTFSNSPRGDGEAQGRQTHPGPHPGLERLQSAGRAPGEKFNEEQMQWLQMIRDHISSSFHFERNDLEMAPFDSRGGLGKTFQLFGADMDGLIDEMNAELAA
jgi:type I site-specific restriction endonuclease